MNEKNRSSFFGKLFLFGKKDETEGRHEKIDDKEEIKSDDIPGTEKENNDDCRTGVTEEEIVSDEKKGLSEKDLSDFTEEDEKKRDVTSESVCVPSLGGDDADCQSPDGEKAFSYMLCDGSDCPVGNEETEETAEEVAAEKAVQTAEKVIAENSGDKEFSSEKAEGDKQSESREIEKILDSTEIPTDEEEPGISSGPATEKEEKKHADNDVSSTESLASGLDMAATAKVFGVSEERLENEFKLYKVDKVAKRTELMLCDQYISVQETATRIKAAISAKLCSVTVLPNRLKHALDAAEKRIPVSVAVCYPLGADDFATRKYAVKKAASTAANGIEIPFDPTAERGVNYKIMLKDYKKIVRAAKRKPVTVILEASSYTDTELTKIVSVLKEAGVKRIKSSAGNKNAVTCAYADKNLAEAAKGKLTVVCCARDYTPEGLVKAFSYGADFVSSKNAVEAINSLRTLLVGKE